MRDANLNRKLVYLGSSEKDGSKMPTEVKDIFIDALKMALAGETHEDAKIFKHHGAGIYEVVVEYKGNAYRAIYSVKYKEVVFVIHIFQKKSHRGSQTPKKDMDLIINRLKQADVLHREIYGKTTKK